MKAILICPAARRNVVALAAAAPLSTLPILGKTLIEHRMEQLVTLGATEVFVSASQQLENIRALVEDGARWGLRVVVCPEIRELSPGEVLAKYRDVNDTGWLPAPYDAALMDYLPSQPGFPLFASYAAWYAAVMNWLPRAVTPDRIGIREIKPGVWVGRHTRVAANAQLHPPCWLGENVFVGGGASVGPWTAVEDRTLIETGVKITESIIGPETFVGEFTEIQHSLAWGDTLINWKLDSCLKVTDAFLLAPLKFRHKNLAHFLRPVPLETRPIHHSWKFSVKTEP